MPPVTCHAVSEIDFEDFTAAFNLAYSDYFTPIVMTPTSFRYLMERDDLSFDASVAALDGDAVVGTGLLGIRGSAGWIGGMGVIPGRRRQGIGRQMMQYLLDRARDEDLSEVSLEVIEANKGAHALYLEMGFEPVRYLLILERHPETSVPATDSIYTAAKQPVDLLLAHYDRFHDVPNCWQRARPSLESLASHIEGWAALRQEQPVGYALGWADSVEVRLIDLAAATAPDRVHIATALLAYLHRQYPHAYGAIYNISDDDPLLPAFEAVGYSVSFRQIEMRRTL